MSYTSEVEADNPNVWTRMEEASGNLADSADNPNTYNPAGSPTYQITGPITSESPNFGIQFNGSTNFACTDSSVFDFGDGPFSLEMWVKRGASQGTVQTLMVQNAYWQMAFLSDNTICLASEGVAVIVASTITITDTTTWHHIVMTKNGSTSADCKIFIDGVDRTGTFTNSTIANRTASAIMGGGVSGEFLTNGHQLAQQALYPSVLTEARVLAHYQAATAVADTGLAWITA